MKDLMPLAVMQSTIGGDFKVAGGTKTEPELGSNALFSGNTAGLSDSNASFLDSLNGLLQAGDMQDGTIVDAALGGKATGGNTLPLASNAAESSRSAVIPVASEVQAQQDFALMVGLPLGVQATVPHDADMPSRAPVIADLSKDMPQTASLLRTTLTAGKAPQSANHPVVSEQVVALPPGQTPIKPDVLLQAHVPLSGLLGGVSDMSQKHHGTNRDMAVKASLLPQPNRGEMVDVQLALKTDALVNETDRLFMSRMHLGTVNQAAELTGNRLAEALLSTTQSASTDAAQASFVRSPIPQAASPTNSLLSPGQAVITETVGMADWGQGMGKQVVWMVNQNISRAEIRLNPANLGPIEVRIDMDNDQVNVAFTSRHAEVREAVEQALPRLREMLEEKGLNLSDADVSQHSFEQQHSSTFAEGNEHASGLPSGTFTNAEDDQQAIDSSQTGLGSEGDYGLHEGLVDFYI
ncbi:MAG: flagellar hook-length control protein FliK [Gammaproteobacteria bacterium]|nr:flagellar hook-length control protein FliK [Gammaproteobacteria bacterium]